MFRRIVPFLVFAFALLGSGCSREEKSAEKPPREARGPEKVKEVPLAPFDALEVPGKVHVKVTKGPTKQARLSGPANYVDGISLEVQERELDGEKRNVLVIDFQERISPPRPIVEVSAPEITHVSGSGAAQIDLGDFSRAQMKIVARKAAKIILAPGAYGELHAEAHMAARILGPEVMVETAHLSALDGPAVVKVGQVGRLSRKSSNGGSVVFSGKPEFMN